MPCGHQGRANLPVVSIAAERLEAAYSEALRAAGFDGEILRFISVHPSGTVVALGEGLETQFWRTDNGAVRWVSVDLGEGIEARRQLLPSADRLHAVACSVLDPGWIEEVNTGEGVLLSAQGLLMYLHPGQVHDLIGVLAERFPDADLVFDAVPGWFSERTMRGMRTRSDTNPHRCPGALARASFSGSRRPPVSTAWWSCPSRGGAGCCTAASCRSWVGGDRVPSAIWRRGRSCAPSSRERRECHGRLVPATMRCSRASSEQRGAAPAGQPPEPPPAGSAARIAVGAAR